jgi:hypothetical protein
MPGAAASRSRGESAGKVITTRRSREIRVMSPAFCATKIFNRVPSEYLYNHK